MREKSPFLFIIPHSGQVVPEEFEGYENVSPVNIFFDSDAGADLLFAIDDNPGRVLTADISRLFVDVDREFRSLPPLTDDGVIKTKTSMNRDVFREGCLPDEIAISNILKRYYFPFHESIRDSLADRNIMMIIECHTHMPVGPENSPDRGRPRPLVITGYTAGTESGIKKTATPEMAMDLALITGRLFESEGTTVAENFRVSEGTGNGYLMKNYGTKSIPMLSLSISRSLFLNDRFFDLERLSFDRGRIDRLKELLAGGLERFRKKFLN